jgi:hypothetical protein
MRFNRFTVLGFLSNWGWYSAAETTLLALEDTVGRELASLEDFIRAKPPVKALLTRFAQIRSNNAVKESQYGALTLELQRMAEEAKQIRLNVLNRGGTDIPDAPVTFPNHQPGALVGEIRTFLEYRKTNRAKGDPFRAGFVIHYNASRQAEFDAVMDTGSKVLYTLDVAGILSIGDPRSTKHSVVAVGQTVKAAGIAQLEIDDRTDVYMSMRDYEQRARDLQATIDTDGDPKKDLAANVAYYRHEAQELRLKLAGYVPPPVLTRNVLIDFDSGHYAPSKAWREAMAAWTAAGYRAKWNPESRRV